MLSSTMNLELYCILTVEKCMFSKDIWVYESLIFGNPPWKLHTRVFSLVDDNDSIVLLTEPQIPVNLKSALAGSAL